MVGNEIPGIPNRWLNPRPAELLSHFQASLRRRTSRWVSNTLSDETETHSSAALALNNPFTYKKNLPVLHLRGGNDTTSPESHIETVRKVLPWGKIITYEGAGHWLMVEKKEEVTRDVLDWLSGVELKSKL